MNIEKILSTETVFFALTLFALLLASLCIYNLVRLSKVAQRSDKRIAYLASELGSSLAVNKKLSVSHILNTALISAIQVKNSIEFCTLLLNNCTHKSDVLITKTIENNLHHEIKNAIAAVNSFEEKRAFLELKIRESYPQLNQKTTLNEVEEFSHYAQTLNNEMQLELESIEKMKRDILKVDEVLDQILLKVAA